jgi:hypothetical protein
LSAVDRGFEPLLGKISICCFSAKHAALGSKISICCFSAKHAALGSKISICCFSTKHAALGSQNRDVQDVELIFMIFL